MKIVKTYEKFNKNLYLKDKKSEEKLLNQRLGDAYICDIVSDGDFDGINYLLNTGWKITEYEGSKNLLLVALQSKQDKMFDYLINNNLNVNDIILNGVIGERRFGVDKKVSNDNIDILKKIVKYGFKFEDDDLNLFDIYLTYYNNNKNVVLTDLIPFADWLLEEYPENYPYVKDYIPDYLLKKYSYLEDSKKYNL